MFLKKHLLSLVMILIINLNFGRLWACACGCGVFEVGTSAMLPTHEGGIASLEYDFMDQGKNWSGTSKAPADNNLDKELQTHFVTFGVQYMFNRSWGLMAEFPYWNRYFKTTDGSGNIVDFNHSAVGDMRVRGVYSGFSPDMSTGLTFGLKLPTGDYTYPNFDRDTEIGTGSTDLLLGAYHVGPLGADTPWNWFVNSEWDQPTLTADGYTPGSEVDAVGGSYYNGWKSGRFKVAPLAQVIGSYRWRDGGPMGHPTDSGYQRIVLSPGIELDGARWKVYADVGFPIYQNVNGNQLVASVLYKLNVGRRF
jgi:hypothetical protein